MKRRLGNARVPENRVEIRLTLLLDTLVLTSESMSIDTGSKILILYVYFLSNLRLT